MRTRGRLTARSVASLSKPGRHADGGNLYLAIDKAGRKRWVFMWTRNGKQREMGLGSPQDISLADARTAAEQARALLRAGADPIEAKRRADAVAAVPTFGAYVKEFLAAKSDGWKNEKHRDQWRMTLTKYAAPLAPIPVDQISVAQVKDCLLPIWTSKPETASRLRGRIEAVLDAAKVAGHRVGENPAAWAGNLKLLMPARSKAAAGHHKALPYKDVPEFMMRLREQKGMAALALEFTILTAARSGETLGALWSEIDLDQKLWTVPAARMKAQREHRVPLCDRAIEILDVVRAFRNGNHIFSGQHRGKPLSNMSMEMVLRRMQVDVTVHGFRSAFRDWCGDKTHFPREVAEAALAHVVGDKAEQAYRRGDALQKRGDLMRQWCAYCGLYDF